MARFLTAAMLTAGACAGEADTPAANMPDSSLSNPDSHVPLVTPEASLREADAEGQQTGNGAAAEECLACHGPFSDIQQATRDYVTPEGTAVNPHTTGETRSEGNPHLSGEGAIECSTCHPPSQMPPTSADAVPTPNIEYCYSCHHQRVFTPCASCHGANGA
jgi:hypothetical protein